MQTSSRLADLMQRLRRVDAWQLLLMGVVIWLIAHYLVLPSQLRIPSGTLLAFASSAVIAVTLMTGRRVRGSDLAFVVGLGLIGLGNSMSGAGRPFPSTMDLFYLGGAGLLAVGAARRYTAQRDLRIDVLLEGIIVTAAGVLLVWELVAQRIFVVLGLEAFPTIVAVAYPAVDILLLGVAVRIVIGSPVRDGALWLTVAGLTSFLLSDVVVSTQLLGSGSAAAFADLGWLASYGLIAVGAIHPGAAQGSPRIERAEVGSRPRVLLLLTAAMLAPLLILHELLVGHVDEVALVAVVGVVLSALVVTRLALAFRALGTTIDQRERLQVELEHRATHDSLTGLANRNHFTRTLDSAVAARTPLAVLLIDLDDVKAINDSLGHESGDRLLREAAERIRSTLRPRDLGARLGGDEFAVLLHDVATVGEVDLIANQLQEALRAPVTLAGRVVLARASMGITLAAGHTADELIRNAGIAMYLAKSQGKDRSQWFDVRLHDDVLARIRVRSELEAAIEGHEFIVHYQPIVDVATGRLVMTEALVRWRHPERGLVAPAEFIDVAETTGLIVPLGRWVLNEALTATHRWQTTLGRPDIGISVNVAARQFEHAGFRDDVVAALAASGVAARSLTLEITESSLLDTAATTGVLAELKALGVQIAVDDFGTGYSSLSYVGRLPVDMVKIDRTFVAALGSDSKEGALAASVISLGKSLDVTTLAEGIENASQLELLRSLGCDLAQGYFLARPMTADALEALIRREPKVVVAALRRAARIGPEAAGI